MHQALSIVERSLGENHPDVATSLGNLAGLLWTTNRLAEAEPLMRRALAIDERSYGPEHPEVARDLNNLVTLYFETNPLAEAELLMRRMVEIFLKFTGDTDHQHPHFQAAIKNYTKLLSEIGHSQPEVQAQINTICKPYGIQFGGGA
jgi:hypothetical protein